MGKRRDFFDRPLAITDVETTGLDYRTHEIIEIGLLLVDPRSLAVIDTLDIKVKPCRLDLASPTAMAVNGYRDEDWLSALDLQRAMLWFAVKTRDAVFASWNITFDWSFIREAFRLTGVPDLTDRRKFCLMSAAIERLRGSDIANVSKDSVAEFLKLPPESKPHRAINGALHALEVYKALPRTG